MTLHAHLSGNVETVLPLYALLSQTPEQLAARALGICAELKNKALEVRTSEAVTGGGTLPEATLPSVAVVWKPRSPEAALTALRRHDPPIIARIQNDEVWLDFKTLFAYQDGVLTEALSRLSDL